MLRSPADRPRILFVDDEPLLLQGITVALRKHYDIVTATSAQQALAILEADSTFPVVVSDFRMPDMNGARFLGIVWDRYPAIVRILLTGAVSEGQNPGAETGFLFRFLVKPCSRKQLVDAIEDALESRQATTSRRAGGDAAARAARRSP